MKKFLNNLSLDARACIPALISIIALFVFGQALSPGFASLQNVSTIAAQAMLLLIISAGQAIVFMAGDGGIDLSVGAFVSLGALLSAEFMGGRNEMIPLGIFIAALFGGLFGLINGLGIQFLKIPALAMTLAMASVIDGFYIWYTNGMPQAQVPSLLGKVGRQWIGQLRPLILIGILVIIALELLMRKTNFGKNIFLIGSNKNAAALCGLKVHRYAVLAYVLSGIFASIGGMLFFGYVGAGQMRMGDDYTMMSIAAVVIGGVNVSGGRGTFIGVTLGSVVYLLITSVLVALGLAPGVRAFFQGIILILLLIINCRSSSLRR